MQIGKNNKPCGNGNGQMWARVEKRKRRHLGGMVNIRRVQNHEYNVPDESREGMDKENSKRCNEDRT